MRRVAIAMFGLLAAGRVSAECKIERFAELPVTMQGFRPMVDARIDARPVRFIVDSGAFFSGISPGSARDLGLRLTPAPSNLRMSGIGGQFDVQIGTVKQFTVAGQTLPKVQFLVGGSGLETGVGLLGQNFLGLYDVEYDLSGGAVRLFQPKGCGSGSFAYWSKDGGFSVPIRDLNAAGRHTVATVRLNGATVDATFDTGAPRTVVSLRAAARAGVKPGGPGVVAQGWESGLGRRMTQGFTAPFKTLDIGSETLRNVRLLIADLGADTDMLIGADFFVAHRLYVSNARRRIDFTYNGGRIFDARAYADAAGSVKPVPIDAAEPTDAEGYARRGALAVTAHEPAKAIADYDRAVALAPKEARYVAERAQVHLLAHQPRLAMADFGAVLALVPDDLDARLARAALRIGDGDREGARSDLDAAARQVSPKSDAHLRIASLYSDLDLFDRAIAEYGLWIAAFPDDSRRPQALNGRCWARALAGTDLAKALADCNAALRAMPREAGFLDSRGWVELRQGANDRAIADYDAALAAAPRMASSLYGRGIAERRLGRTDKADADLAAAMQIAPKVPERAHRLGIQ